MDIRPFAGLAIVESKTSYDIGQIGTEIVNFGNSVIAQQISETTTRDNSNSNIGIKLGVYIDDSHRIYLCYSDFKLDENYYDIRTDTVLLNYDYLFKSENDFIPFIGIHVGENNLEMETQKDTGIVYGVQLGVLYEIHKNFEFELSGSYSLSNAKVNLDQHTVIEGASSFDGVASVEVKNISKIAIGANIKF